MRNKPTVQRLASSWQRSGIQSTFETLHNEMLTGVARPIYTQLEAADFKTLDSCLVILLIVFS
jgi:hypothetical protein